jgi:uncharacterized OB-fold protein
MSAGQKLQLPMFQPGLFETGAGGPWLLGARCRKCGRGFYPRAARCLDCLAGDLAPERLSRDGTLECFTTVHMPSSRMAPPYCVGYVRLPDGLRVFAPITADDRALTVGMAMRLAEYRLGHEPDESLAYCFVPVEP